MFAYTKKKTRCVTFEFDVKQHHWFTARLANKSHCSLASSKTTHHSDANEPPLGVTPATGCCIFGKLAGYKLPPLILIYTEPTHTFQLKNDRKGWGITVGLRWKHPGAAGSLQWVMMCVSEGRRVCIEAADFLTVTRESDGILRAQTPACRKYLWGAAWNGSE